VFEFGGVRRKIRSANVNDGFVGANSATALDDVTTSTPANILNESTVHDGN
jgi:hypothetical protein